MPFLLNIALDRNSAEKKTHQGATSYQAMNQLTNSDDYIVDLTNVAKPGDKMEVKVLKVKMDDLANLLDDTRLNVSCVLNKWQEEGLIEMRRKEFVFHDIAQLRAI